MKLHGAFAEFQSVEGTLGAAEKVREAGYTKWDVHSPFPIHGIDEAMGIRPTGLPWLVLACGLTGLSLGTLMIWWMNGIDYPYRTGGKPFFTVWSAIPIMFECTVLLSAFGAFLGQFVLNDLPMFSRPWFHSERFRRVTSDRFMITIDAADPRYDEERTVQFLRSLGPVAVEEVAEVEGPDTPPRPVIMTGVCLAIAAMIPLLLFARARETTSETPKTRVFFDMSFQEKKKAQTTTTLFSDGRAERPVIDGAIARGALQEDGVFFRGEGKGTTYTAAIPLAVDEALMRRGKERFEIYCMPCHGLNGEGDGLIARRADQIKATMTGWAPPTNLTDERIRKEPAGMIFQTITNGIRTMPAYGPQVPPRDRWAIILYLRALEKGASGTVADVPPEMRAELDRTTEQPSEKPAEQGGAGQGSGEGQGQGK